MFITITSIKLRSVWKFFALSSYALRITRQLYKAKGFLKFKKTGLGTLHYTLSVWDSKESMQAFSYNEGAHRESMKESGKIASELRTYSYETDKIPDWKEAKALLATQGKVLKF